MRRFCCGGERSDLGVDNENALKTPGAGPQEGGVLGVLQHPLVARVWYAVHS